MSVFKKNGLSFFMVFAVIICKPIFASTSLSVNGHAGIVSQYSNTTLPGKTKYLELRVPIGVTLIASPFDKLNLYLGLDYAYQNYPQNAVLLGQTTQTSRSTTGAAALGAHTPMPFSNMTSGGAVFGQKSDAPTMTTAYFSFQTPVGLLKAGRMPRQWGLGIWHNDEWKATGGGISTSDAIAFTTDLNLFDATVYYERFGTSIGGLSPDQNAVAYTGEARLKLDPADVPSSGIAREIGAAYSIFNHKASNTSLHTFDGYAKIYLSKLFIGGEVLYPMGTTKSSNYQTLGGGTSCTSNSNINNQTCSSQNFSAQAALLKFRLLVSQEENVSLAAIEQSQKLMGTAERLTSNTFGFSVGYASGGANQFNNTNNFSLGSANKKITGIFMHPNIQPSFLMFNNTTPPINGMPTGAITNTTFIRADYVDESPGIGSLNPIVVWGKLNSTNPSYNSKNSICTNKNSLSINPSSAINPVCVGGNDNLGVELDLAYNYTTLEHFTFGADVGYWAVGNAWKLSHQDTPSKNYGVRIYTGTEF